MSSTIKIDSDLLKEVENIIRKKDKKLKYSSKKQFIDIAVLELLDKEKYFKSDKLNNNIKKR